MAMAALWALAALGAYANYDGDNSGDDSGDETAGADLGSYTSRGGYGNSYGIYGNYGNYGEACSDELAAEKCMFCDPSFGIMTKLGVGDLSCAEIANDGECDSSCNSANCSWDGADCFHGDR